MSDIYTPYIDTIKKEVLKMKEKILKAVKIAANLTLTVVGLAIGLYGASNLLPKKKYAGGDISLPDKEQEEETTE